MAMRWKSSPLDPSPFLIAFPYISLSYLPTYMTGLFKAGAKLNLKRYQGHSSREETHSNRMAFASCSGIQPGPPLPIFRIFLARLR